MKNHRKVSTNYFQRSSPTLFFFKEKDLYQKSLTNRFLLSYPTLFYKKEKKQYTTEVDKKPDSKLSGLMIVVIVLLLFLIFRVIIIFCVYGSDDSNVPDIY